MPRLVQNVALHLRSAIHLREDQLYSPTGTGTGGLYNMRAGNQETFSYQKARPGHLTPLPENLSHCTM